MYIEHIGLFEAYVFFLAGWIYISGLLNEWDIINNSRYIIYLFNSFLDIRYSRR